MRHSSPVITLLIIMLSALLAGCSPSAISTEREYVLVESRDGHLVVVDDDDPLYDRFDDQVLSDAFLHELLAIYENTTEAFLATNKMSSLTQALSNWPIVILGSQVNGALLRTEVLSGEDPIKVSLAIGLRHESGDLADLRDHMAPAMAPVLMRLVGCKLPESVGDTSQAQPQTTTSREAAFVEGLSLALEALHLDAQPQLQTDLQNQAQTSPKAKEQLERWRRITENDYRYRFAEGQPTQELRAPDEMRRTPGVVATFLHRWLQTNGPYYPQRHMLWMTNYDTDQAPYAKVLLAMNRMPDKRNISIDSFLESYVETFPAERQAISQLAADIFGALPPQR